MYFVYLFPRNINVVNDIVNTSLSFEKKLEIKINGRSQSKLKTFKTKSKNVKKIYFETSIDYVLSLNILIS